MPSPRFGSISNSMYGSIGGLANRILRGRNIHPLSQAYALSPAANSANIKMGKRVLGVGAAMGGLGMANRRGPVGGYNPQRPIMQVPRNGQAI